MSKNEKKKRKINFKQIKPTMLSTENFQQSAKAEYKLPN